MRANVSSNNGPGLLVTSDERRLIERCLDSDQDACEDLVRRFATVVGTVIWRATGDRNVIDDLAQEAFLRVFRGLPFFGGRAKLSTWIYTVAHHVAIDHLRARRSAARLFFEDAPADVLNEVPGRDLNPEMTVARNEMSELVHRAVADLPDKYRLPLVYAAIDGLDHDAIGVILGVRPTTVKTLVFRARQMVKTNILASLQSGCARGEA